MWELALSQVPVEWFFYLNIHSLLYVPGDPCDSLSTMMKHSGLTRCTVEWLWWWKRDGALRCSFSLSPKVLPDYPIYSSSQLMCGHLNLYMTPLFWSLLSLSLGQWGGFLWCWHMQKIVTLLEFCLKNTYILFQGRYYKQVHGDAMGSPISPLIANLFMESLKSMPLALPHTPTCG